MTPLANLLASLVEINSVNPALVPGSPGEPEIARYLMAWFKERGIETEIDEGTPQRPSVLARVPGKLKGRSLLLNAHLDTVGVAGMPESFRARIRDGRMYGRGAYDMKAGLAACMLALEDIQKIGLGGDVIFAAVSDEEHASLGVQNVLQHVTADAAIVTEPTSLQICVAHKGFTWHEITTSGRAAHGSRPDLGVDAIAHMGRVLNQLEALQSVLSGRTPHPLLGHASIHAALISGGQELSSYPATCTLQLERRTLPEEDITAVESELEKLLADLASVDPRFQAKQQTLLIRPSFRVDEDEPIVQTLRRQAEVVLGRAPPTIGASFWMDAGFFAQAGIPTVVLGPHGDGAHSVDEWVDLRSVELCREILVRTALEFCS